MKTIKQTVHINASPQEVYEAYTDAEKHAEFTARRSNRMKLTLARFIGKFIGDVHKQDDNQKQCGCDLSERIDSPKIVHFSNSFSKKTVIIRKIIPSTISKTKIPILERLSGIEMFTPMTGAINQAAEMLIERLERAFCQGLGIFSTKSNVTGGRTGINKMRIESEGAVG